MRKTITTLGLAALCTLGMLTPPASTAQNGFYPGVRGVILGFDDAGEAFGIFNPRIGRLWVKVNDNFTRVAINQTPAELADLRVGMSVSVSGQVAPVTRSMRARFVSVRQ